jgi:hypothetical protein
MYPNMIQASGRCAGCAVYQHIPVSMSGGTCDAMRENVCANVVAAQRSPVAAIGVMTHRIICPHNTSHARHAPIPKQCYASNVRPCPNPLIPSDVQVSAKVVGPQYISRAAKPLKAQRHRPLCTNVVAPQHDWLMEKPPNVLAPNGYGGGGVGEKSALPEQRSAS